MNWAAVAITVAGAFMGYKYTVGKGALTSDACAKIQRNTVMSGKHEMPALTGEQIVTLTDTLRELTSAAGRRSKLPAVR